MAHFPEPFRKLPEADVPLEGVSVRLLRGPTASATFWEATKEVTLPEHRHGAQWGVVLEGELHLTVGSETRMYHRGEEYFIPAGVPHGGTLRAGTRAIDFFEEPDRYRPKR